MGEREDNQIPKGPDWLTSWSWWFAIVGMGAALVAARWFSNGGHF